LNKTVSRFHGLGVTFNPLLQALSKHVYCKWAFWLKR